MSVTSASFTRIAVRAIGLVIVLPTVVILYLFKDNLAGKELVLGLLLFLSTLGFYLIWSAVGTIRTIQGRLERISSGEPDEDEPEDEESQLQEMTGIIDSLNRLTVQFQANTGQLEKFIGQFAALSELTDVVARVPDIHELLHLVLAKALPGAQAMRGTVLLVTESRSDLELAASEGWAPPVGRIIERKDSIADRVIRTGQPFLVKDASDTSQLQWNAAPDADLYATSRSFLILPLKTKREVLGVVCLSDKVMGGSFTRHDQQFITVMLGQVGYAIENARLLRQAQDAARDLRKTVHDQEIEIQAAEGRIQEAEKLSSLGRLAGGVAHDFNNLLQAILTYTRLARQATSEDSPAAPDLDQVRRAAERAAQLTRQLLAFGRRQMLQPAYINLNRTISEFTTMIERLLGEHIELEVASSAIPTIHADPSQIEQVLLNLCLNARDAMPDGGKITVDVEGVELSSAFCESRDGLAAGRYVRLEVADTGCGMDQNTLAQVFEPFFTTKAVGKGTGLGLATVYGIIRQHRGYIDVSSKPGQGTRFSVYLPAVDRQADTVVQAIVPITEGEPATILVAEDERVVRELLVRILEGVGHKVIAATDGVEAIAMFDAHRSELSLAVLDAVMPGKTGREVHEHIRANAPEMPVLFSSGYDSDVANDGFIQEQGLTLIQKPFDPDELLARVREALDAALAETG